MQKEEEQFENYMWRWVMSLPGVLSDRLQYLVFHFKGEIQHPWELHLSTGGAL